MTLSQFLAILWARRWAALFILLATVAAALTWVATRPVYYVARAPLLVDLRASDPVPGATQGGNMVPATFIATQIDIVKSDRVAERVVEMLGLDKQPAEVERWKKDPNRGGSLVTWLAQDLKSGLDVKPARESNIINVSFTSRNPAAAAEMANAFARAYLDTSVELRTDPARRYSVWFEDQLEQSKVNQQQAQTRLSEFQQRAGIVSSDERVDHETTRLNELSSQLSRVQGETTDSQSKRGAPSDTVAEVIQSGLINGLKADISRLEAKFQESAERLGSNHPTMQSMQAELSSLRSRLASETAKINTSINTTYQVGRTRERQLQEAVNAQRARVLALNKQRGELSLLQRDVEVAQRGIRSGQRGCFTNRSCRALTNQTNVMRLADAVEPLQPAGLTDEQAITVGAVAGVLLAIAGAFLLELLNRRVRTPDDLYMALGLPVLASIPVAGATSKQLLLGGSRRMALGHARSGA